MQVDLAAHLEEGAGVIAPDGASAALWYAAGARGAGDGGASLRRWGVLLAKGGMGTGARPDARAARRLFLAAAAAGDADGMYNLARMIEHGEGGEDGGEGGDDSDNNGGGGGEGGGGEGGNEVVAPPYLTTRDLATLPPPTPATADPLHSLESAYHDSAHYDALYWHQRAAAMGHAWASANAARLLEERCAVT